ncbi:MAG: cation transporter [Calditrichaeota bacterium]|nr:cation transporter [Calditrichota bacterium]
MSEHNHNHHNHIHTHHDTKNISKAFFINLLFTLIEIIGGMLTNSIAILSDALHDLGDSISLGISWYFQKLSQKKSDQKFTFGYSRFSIFGAIVNSFVLVSGSLLIIVEAVPRLFAPEKPDTAGMLILAILGIIVNGAAVMSLQKGKSLNEKVVSLHLMEDVLGWLAVLIGSIVMMNYDLPVIDPLLSLGIAAFILFNVYKNLRSALKIILQGTPKNVDLESVKIKLGSMDKTILDFHDLHLWTMDGEYNVLTIHVVMKENYDLKKLAGIKDKIREQLKDENINHITIEFENKEEECIHIDC